MLPDESYIQMTRLIFFVVTSFLKQSIATGSTSWSLRHMVSTCTPGEKDSFGWLAGCIEYPDHERVVVYG